ncbi:ABC transporter permease [Metabacillus fastidiosus]|uniref:ABC transporter permease n=1 Tax=Metabacillus fastidiosus TaxID=1458 RepID=UPI000825F22F|nr:ABC transporter permease [Metabacillus fastidiosus]MED4464591.1 ABC transporter permease [Metabacillus fastidiosus]
MKYKEAVAIKLKPAKVKIPSFKKIFKVREGSFLGVGVIFLLLVVWELASSLELINPIFSSSPSLILKESIVIIQDGSIWQHIIASSKIFLVGFFLAIVVGIPVGLIMGWFKKANQAFGPLVAAVYATPDLALMPLFIVWLGMGMGSKVFLIFLGAVFPIILNIQMAMRSIDNDLVKVAKSYGASQNQIFRTIALPVSIPFIMTGLQIASSRALIGVVGAEVFGAQEGIGYMIRYAGMNFQMDKVFVYVIIITLLAIILDRSLNVLNRKFDSWRGLD